MSDLSLAESLEIIDSIQIDGEHCFEQVCFEDCVGRILAEDLTWDRHHPPYNRAAMDGFAFPGQPQPGLNYRVIGESRAGEPFQGEIPAGSCIKIATGACVPDGCDTVIQWEKTRISGSSVEIKEFVVQGGNIHRCGSDQKKGSLALRKGSKIKLQHLALLSTIGAEKVRVLPEIRVTLLCTGSELVPIQAAPEPEQIRASNFYLLDHLLKRQPGISLIQAGFQGDDQTQLHGFLAKHEAETDFFIITGGVGTSDYDLVPGLSEKLGFQTLMHGLAIKPGHPLFFARKGNQFLLGLPGNPVSSFACYIMFGQRILQRLQGLEPKEPEFYEAGEDLINKGGRLLMMPVFCLGKRVLPVVWNGSGDVSAISNMEGLALINPQTTLQKGCDVPVVLLEAM